jgi:TolB protein
MFARRFVLRALSTAFLAIAVGCSSDASGPNPIPLPLRSGGIVFHGLCPNENGAIFTIAADGTDRRRLTNPGANLEPVWSLDGSRIAFSGATTGSLIAVMNADGTGRHDITTPMGDRNPTWSPDGARIAFESRRTDYSRIAIVNADGSGLYEQPGFAMDPAWSPDGRSIAFTTSGQNGWVLGIRDVDGQNARLLTTNATTITSDQYPTWSPDGSRIAFVRYWQSDSSAIRVIDRDGRNQRTVLRTIGLTPAWSPDGTMIAFAQAVPGTTSLTHIYVVNIDGTGLRQLTDGQCRDYNPSW